MGDPVISPVTEFNLAHAGKFAALKVNALPSASLAVTWNEYSSPAITAVTG